MHDGTKPGWFYPEQSGLSCLKLVQSVGGLLIQTCAKPVQPVADSPGHPIIKTVPARAACRMQGSHTL